MKIESILIANRGEIAVRIARTAAELDIRSVAIYSEDDSESMHLRVANEICAINKKGPAAYLDAEAIVNIAKGLGCDAIHPGYGFLSENGDFARRCAEAGLIFIGPGREILDLFGNKARARELAVRCQVPLLGGTQGSISLEEAKAFFASLEVGASVMLKAIAGGGGRGMRAVHDPAELEEAYNRCRSEAESAFGNGDLYIEKLVQRPRHIEVQIVGDGRTVVNLGERECTIQRRNQKIIEIAPSPSISQALRERIIDASMRMANEVSYTSLGTFEFLVDDASSEPDGSFAFMEANPRIQVEHTVTEEVTGIDLVKLQIELASGRSLAECGIGANVNVENCYAVQLRINTETMDRAGNVGPDAGVVRGYELPAGPGIRVDSCGYVGCRINPAFDSLLAKLIVTSKSSRYENAMAKAARALREFRIDGISTNIAFLQHLLTLPDVIQNRYYTRYIDDNIYMLISSMEKMERKPGDPEEEAMTGGVVGDLQSAALSSASSAPLKIAPAGTTALPSPVHGRIVSIQVEPGEPMPKGKIVAVIEAMKMEHTITSDLSGYVRRICVKPDDVVARGASILFLEEADIEIVETEADEDIDLEMIRPDLADVMERHSHCLDINRPEAVAKRRSRNKRTARENIDDLCDPDTFIEYGALLLAAQRGRLSKEELIRKSPADGMIAGMGSVNSDLFGKNRARCLMLSYDYTVFAGTQGIMNHKKLDRMLDVAHEWQISTVLFAEGGGGRPGDSDGSVFTGLDLTTFSRFAGLSGKAPLVGIVSGPCFAGNAALLGCCDVIIAAGDSNIGMGGPAMIEGGGLGSVKTSDIGPIDVQTRNGVVDIAVKDEVEAVDVARKYLSYFQGKVDNWEAADQRLLRHAIPENRVRVYDVRAILEKLADTGSVLELRRSFGPGIITALARIEGRPFGVMASNPMHMGGAIEADAADKAARFMQLCNAHNLPMLSLCDTPGFMVGPEIEEQAQVRHVCRMFIGGANLRVPFFTVVLRKGYGLGAMAMAGGSFRGSFFTVAWPSGEFGAMGLEGAVKHAFRKELAAVGNDEERDALFKSLVGMAYDNGKGTNIASVLEIDAVIDPAETRRWIMQGLMSIPERSEKEKGSLFIDSW